MPDAAPGFRQQRPRRLPHPPPPAQPSSPPARGAPAPRCPPQCPSAGRTRGLAQSTGSAGRQARSSPHSEPRPAVSAAGRLAEQRLRDLEARLRRTTRQLVGEAPAQLRQVDVEHRRLAQREQGVGEVGAGLSCVWALASRQPSMLPLVAGGMIAANVRDAASGARAAGLPAFVALDGRHRVHGGQQEAGRGLLRYPLTRKAPGEPDSGLMMVLATRDPADDRADVDPRLRRPGPGSPRSRRSSRISDVLCPLPPPLCPHQPRQALQACDRWPGWCRRLRRAIGRLLLRAAAEPRRPSALAPQFGRLVGEHVLEPVDDLPVPFEVGNARAGPAMAIQGPRAEATRAQGAGLSLD